MPELRINDVSDKLHRKVRMAAAANDLTVRLMVIKILEDHITEYLEIVDDVPKAKKRKKIE